MYRLLENNQKCEFTQMQVYYPLSAMHIMQNVGENEQKY